MELREMNGILAEVKRFGAKELREGVLAADAKRDTAWLAHVWEKGAQLDLPFLAIPLERGGLGLPPLVLARVLETLSRECAGVAAAYAHHFTACMALAHGGSEGGQRVLEQMAAKGSGGYSMATIAFSDPASDSALRLNREKGRMCLSGSSLLVCGASLATYFVLFFHPANAPESVCGVVVEKGAENVVVQEDAWVPGLCAPGFARIAFDDYILPKGSLLDGGLPAADIPGAILDTYHGLVAAMAVGCAATCLEKSLAHAMGRYQFGKNIIHHSEIQRMLGCMEAGVFSGQAAYSQALSEHGVPGKGVYAKTLATDAAMGIATDAVQIFGGYGYMHEYGMEKRMRDIKTLQLLGGSNPHILAAHIRAGTCGAGA